MNNNLQQNKDGNWEPAVPLPYYGIMKKCGCGKRFWKEINYEKHFKQDHIGKDLWPAHQPDHVKHSDGAIHPKEFSCSSCCEGINQDESTCNHCGNHREDDGEGLCKEC